MLPSDSSHNFLFDDARRLLQASIAEFLPYGADTLPVSNITAALNPHDVLVGAIGFAPTHPVALAIAKPQWKSRIPGRAPPIQQIDGEGTELGDYRGAVKQALAEIDHGVLRKVVLSRAIDVRLMNPMTIRTLAAGLRYANPTGYLFAAPLPDGATLVGLSPELLLSQRGLRIRAVPLAGSRRRTGHCDQDAASAAELRASAKDLQEHRFVIDAIRAVLQPICRVLDMPAQPTVIRTATMLHLGTSISGELRSSQTSSLQLALALHPTPAVCGTPTDEARQLIATLENVDREYFAGAVGWCNHRGDGDWAVAIRCARVESDHQRLRVYAGAGIVAGSDADAEHQETTAKLATIFNALGIENAVPQTAVTGAMS